MDKLYPEQTQYEAETVQQIHQTNYRSPKLMYWPIRYAGIQGKPAPAGENDASIHQTNQGG